MQKVTVVAAFLMLACISTVTAASEASVKTTLQKKYPDIHVEKVNKIPLAGMYEVYADGQLIYTDENVAYLFINGSLIDADKKLNLTEERMSELTAIKFEQLPLNLAFKKV